MGVHFVVKNNIVISDSLIGKGESYFIDKLPLFIKMKGISSLDFFDKLGGNSFLKGTTKRHWAIPTLLRILGLIIIFIVLSSAHFLAFFITMRFARIKSLNNGLIILIGLILTITLNYIYFIFITAHVIKEEYWFTIIIMIIILVLSVRKITGRVNYHRCPQCRTMWTTEDKGTELKGKTHKTQNKSQTKYSHTTETSDTITRHYKTEKWKERSTEKQLTDHRYCHN